MKIQWNKVTWYSKLIAVIVFAATFVIAFNLGIFADQTYFKASLNQISIPANTQTGGKAGAHCGGFIRNAPTCASGYHCQLKVSNPDTGGTCVKG